MMMFVKITYSPAVGNEIAVKAPFFKLVHKAVTCAGGFTVHTVVCAHNALNFCVLYNGFKGRKICLFKLLFGHLCIKLVAESFGAAVDCKMLCAGGCTESFSLSLQALHIRFAVFGGKIRVLAVGLVSTSPSWITENVDVGCPEGKSLVNVPVAVL